MRLAHRRRRLATSSSRTPTCAAVVDEGVLQLRLDAACDADGRIVLVHAVPVWQHAVHGTVRGMELWAAAERQGRSAALQRWLLAPGLPARSRAWTTTAIERRRQPARRHVTPEGLAAEVADRAARRRPGARRGWSCPSPRRRC